MNTLAKRLLIFLPVSALILAAGIIYSLVSGDPTEKVTPLQVIISFSIEILILLFILLILYFSLILKPMGFQKSKLTPATFFEFLIITLFSIIFVIVFIYWFLNGIFR